jgi:hypothetical protein
MGAPGPHDFAVRADGVRLAPSSRPPHPALNVRDDAYAPHRGGMAQLSTHFGKKESRIFLRRHLEPRDALDSTWKNFICAHESSGVPKPRKAPKQIDPMN